MAYSSTRRQPPVRSWQENARGHGDGPSDYSEPLKPQKQDVWQKPNRGRPGGGGDKQGPGKYGGGKGTGAGKGAGAGKGGMVEDGPTSLNELDLETALKRLKCLSAVQCAGGLMAVIAGVIALVYAWPMKLFPAISAVPLWSGAIVVAGASCGIHASRQETSAFSELIRNLVLAQFVLACISMVTNGLMLGWSAWINWDCGKETPADWCMPNDKELYGISIFCIIVAIFVFFVTIPIISIYCFLRNTFYSVMA